MNFDYEQWTNDQLIEFGFNPEELTQEQKDVILQPLEAPENYMMDGEITSAQAEKIWKNNLVASGLSPENVRKAIKVILG
jgi:hypothetical protein